MKYLSIFASVLLATASAYGQSGESCRTASDPTLQKPELYAGYDCVNLLDSTAVTVQPTGSGSFTVCKIVKVMNTRGAVANRILKYDYDPLTAHAEFHRVTIYKANGDVINLDITQQQDYAAPARAIYWGARQIMMEIGRLDPGDIIDYQINKKGFTYALLTGGTGNDESRFIPPMRGQFYDIVPFWTTEPTVRKVYKVNIPMEKEMQFQFYQGECTSSMRYEDGRKAYTFVSTDIMPTRREPNMVDLFDAAPKLMMSSTPRWQDKSLWFNKVNEDYGSFRAIPEAQKKVDELIQGKKTEMEKIAVLTHWVADNIRYSGISMGKGEGYTLHNLKMNYTDRCGVCKDIAGTLIAFLRMAGFEAYPAMTMAGSRVDGRIAHRGHTGRPLQPLCRRCETFQRNLYAARSYLGPLLPRTVEQCRTTAKLFTGSSRRFRSLSHAGFRTGKPLCPHKSQQPLGCQRYTDRTVHDHSRRTVGQQYPPYLHHRLAVAMAGRIGKPTSCRIT